MNVNEYGIQLQMGVSFNMINHTSLMFNFTRPDATTFSRTGSLGIIPVSTPAGNFAANTYANYTFVNGDISQVGDWQVRLVYQDATPAQLISSIGHFTINP